MILTILLGTVNVRLAHGGETTLACSTSVNWETGQCRPRWWPPSLGFNSLFKRLVGNVIKYLANYYISQASGIDLRQPVQAALGRHPARANMENRKQTAQKQSSCWPK